MVWVQKTVFFLTFVVFFEAIFCEPVVLTINYALSLGLQDTFGYP